MTGDNRRVLWFHNALMVQMVSCIVLYNFKALFTTTYSIEIVSSICTMNTVVKDDTLELHCPRSIRAASSVPSVSEISH
jgi:hypothetical protein